MFGFFDSNGEMGKLLCHGPAPAANRVYGYVYVLYNEAL